MSNPSTCPAREQIRKYVSGQLDEAQSELVAEHLQECPRCSVYVQGQYSTAEDHELRGDRLEVTATRQEDSDLTLAPTPFDPTLPDAEPDRELIELFPDRQGTSLGWIDDYEVQSELGRGGMGLVFKGFDRVLHRVVAIKVMSPRLASSERARRRFLREARAAAGVNHPNIVTIHAVGEYRGIPYLVMEYVAGRTLRQRIVGASPGTDRSHPHQHADRRRARPGPRARGDSPRHQAGEHPARRYRGAGEDRRFRAGARGARRHRAHHGRPGDRDALLHGAGTGPRRAGRPEDRPVLSRLRHVRDGRGPFPVHGQAHPGRDPKGLRRGAPSARRGQPQGPEAPRTGRQQAAREEPRGPFPVGRGGRGSLAPAPRAREPGTPARCPARGRPGPSRASRGPDDDAGRAAPGHSV